MFLWEIVDGWNVVFGQYWRERVIFCLTSTHVHLCASHCSGYDVIPYTCVHTYKCILFYCGGAFLTKLPIILHLRLSGCQSYMCVLFVCVCPRETLKRQFKADSHIKSASKTLLVFLETSAAQMFKWHFERVSPGSVFVVRGSIGVEETVLDNVLAIKTFPSLCVFSICLRSCRTNGVVWAEPGIKHQYFWFVTDPNVSKVTSTTQSIRTR